MLSLLILAAAVVSFLYLVRPVNDPDFFWHLKTGEWIWQHKGLPADDPFSFTTQGLHTKRAHLIMSGYWLSNIVSYLSYAAGGMDGIIILRFFAALAFICALILLREGDPIVYAGVSLLSLVFFFSMYPFDRPQVFSFIFFAFLLYLLRRLVDEGRAAEGLSGVSAAASSRLFEAFAVPVVMLLWANMHRGFIIGQMLIGLVLVCEGIKFFRKSDGAVDASAYKRLALSGMSGIAAGFVNPNFYYPLLDPFYFHSVNNVEYLSVIEYFRRFNSPLVFIYGAILLLTLTGLILSLKKTDLATVLLLAGTGLFSFLQMRYIAFFMIAAVPFVCGFISVRFKRVGYVVPAAAVAVALFFSSAEARNLGNLGSRQWIDGYLFPARAAEFISAADIRGNMYNHFNFGGYLIWRLAPERKVFIDGRELDKDIYDRSLSIISAYDGDSALPSWRSLFEAYKINYVIIPLFEPSGRVPALAGALLKDREWIPVFFHLNSMVLVKDSPENYPVIRKYSIPRDYFVEDLIGVCNTLIGINPLNISAYIAKGDLYRFSGRMEKAGEAYEKVLTIAPLNSPARERLQLVEKETRKAPGPPVSTGR